MTRTPIKEPRSIPPAPLVPLVRLPIAPAHGSKDQGQETGDEGEEHFGAIHLLHISGPAVFSWPH